MGNSDIFTVQGFDSPEEVLRKIGRVNSQEASAFGLNFANSLAPNTSNRKRILAQIGASFGHGLAKGMGVEQEPEVQQARVRSKLLEGVNWQDKDDLTSRMRAAVAAKDHKMALFFSGKLDEIGKEELALTKEKRMQEASDARAEIAVASEIRKQAYSESRERLNIQKMKNEQIMLSLRERTVSTGEGRLSLSREEFDTFKQARLDNFKARYNTLVADAQLKKAQSGYIKGTVPDPTNSEREEVLNKLMNVDSYNTYTKGMNREELRDFAAWMASETAVIAYRDGGGFSAAFDKLYEDYVNPQDGSTPILGANNAWYSTLGIGPAGVLNRDALQSRPPERKGNPMDVSAPPSGFGGPKLDPKDPTGYPTLPEGTEFSRMYNGKPVFKLPTGQEVMPNQ